MCSQSTHARPTGNVTLHPLFILPHPGEMDDSSGVDSDSDLFELVVLLALKRRRKKGKDAGAVGCDQYFKGDVNRGTTTT